MPLLFRRFSACVTAATLIPAGGVITYVYSKKHCKELFIPWICGVGNANVWVIRSKMFENSPRTGR